MGSFTVLCVVDGRVTCSILISECKINITVRPRQAKDGCENKFCQYKNILLRTSFASMYMGTRHRLQTAAVAIGLVLVANAVHEQGEFLETETLPLALCGVACPKTQGAPCPDLLPRVLPYRLSFD